MQPDDHIVASNKVLCGTVTQFTRSFVKLGGSATLVDPDDPENFRRAITPATKMIFVESLANPGGVVVDLEKVAAIAHAAGIPLVVDNTLASPFLCRPIEWGADIVVHSTTKFLSGRSEEHTSELQSLMRISYAVFCL